MKNKLLSVLVLMVCMTAAKAQLTNVSFENWNTRTSYLSLSLLGTVHDTAVANEADGWTSTNMITAGTLFNKTLVTQSSTAKAGSSAMQLATDSLSANISGLAVNLVAPGFVLAGQFPIDLNSFAGSAATGNFNPLTVPGAGTAIDGRKAAIGGYLKFAPQGGDTAYVIALLRKGSTVVAQASYRHASTDAAYVPFSAPFVYQSCLQPDTLVYIISSGNPYTYNNLISGQPTGLHAGTSLLADSMWVSDTLSTAFAVAPIVVGDTANTVKNTPVTIPVSLNDVSCYSYPLTVSVSTQPIHGTAAVSAAGDSIVYTPAAGYIGLDTFYYTSSVNGSPSSSPGMTRVKVVAPTGLVEVAEGQIRVYPNPAKDNLHIINAGSAYANVAIYDMLGNLIKTDAVTSNMTIDVSSFTEGIYIIRFAGSEGKVINSSRFTVVK